MSVEFKSSWEGEYPFVILLSSPEVHDVLYYETGFEQLHPLPSIIDWMEERDYSYQSDWKVVSVSPRREWGICFKQEPACQLFLLKWL